MSDCLEASILQTKPKAWGRHNCFHYTDVLFASTLKFPLILDYSLQNDLQCRFHGEVFF